MQITDALFIVKWLESLSLGISELHQRISNLNLGSDPCKIKYVTKRLNGNELSVIVSPSRPEISPATYAQLKEAQCTSTAVERSFSMLQKLLRDDRNFRPENVKKYIVAMFNKSQ